MDPVVITTDAVASARLPALRVLHEDGPGGWQVYDDVEPLKDPAVLTKQKLLVLDPSIATLKDLPVSWEASRENSSDRWRRRKVKQ